MRPVTICVVAVAVFSVAALMALFHVEDDAAVYVLKPGERSLIEVGERIYVDNCASCHGANLEGEPNWRARKTDGRLPAPPHDDSGHTWHHTDQALFEITKYGIQHFAGPDYESDMPAFDGTLSDNEIVAALSFIKAQWSDDARAAQDAINGRSGP